MAGRHADTGGRDDFANKLNADMGAIADATLCVIARSVNDSGQISADAGPVCSD